MENVRNKTFVCVLLVVVHSSQRCRAGQTREISVWPSMKQNKRSVSSLAKFEAEQTSKHDSVGTAVSGNYYHYYNNELAFVDVVGPC